MEQPKDNWYVLRAISGKEKKAREYILGEVDKRPGWEDIILQVLVPTERVKVKKGGNKELKDRNLYPGYVFIEIKATPEKLKDIVPVIVNIPNVLDFLCQPVVVESKENGKIVKRKEQLPIPMTPNDVEQLLRRVDQQKDAVDGSDSKFEIGEKVKIIEGPFEQQDAEVIDVSYEHHKLTVTIMIFNRPNEVEIEFSQVEKLGVGKDN